jgi:hypothetical protein
MLLSVDMQQDIKWFKDRVGTCVLRGTTEVFIKDEDMAEQLFKRQSEDYVFVEK